MVLNKTWQHIVDPLPEKNISMDVFIGKTLVNSVFVFLYQRALAYPGPLPTYFYQKEDLSPDVAALSVNLSTDPNARVSVLGVSLRGCKTVPLHPDFPNPKAFSA